MSKPDGRSVLPSLIALPRRAQVILAMFSASALLAIFLGFLIEPRDVMVQVQGKYGYFATAFAMGFLALVLGWHAVRNKGGDLLRERVSRHAIALALAPALVLAALWLSPPTVRVLGDEAELLGVSLAMHENRDNVHWLQGLYVHGEGYLPASFTYDKRAPGYPFLLSLLHDARGYDIGNAFVLNAVAGIAVLLLIYGLGLQFGGRGVGLMALVALASFPVFWQSVASAGFETVNLVWILAGILVVSHLKTEPEWPPVVLLVAMGAVVGLFRYESVLFTVAFLAIALLYTPWRRLEAVPALLILAPLALVATAWQVFVPFDTEVPPDVEAFSIGNLIANAGHALRFLSNLGTTSSSSAPVFLLSLVGLVVLVRQMAKRSRPGLAQWVLTATWAVWTVVVLSYWHGNLEQPMTMRLSLPLLPLLALAAAAAVESVHRRLKLPLFRSLTAIALLAFSAPVLVTNPDDHGNETSAVFRAVQGFIERQYPGENLLLVSPNSPWFSALQVGSVAFGTLEANAPAFLELRQNGALKEILILELIKEPEFRAWDIHTFESPRPTSTLFVCQVGSKAILRISRLVE